MLGSVADRPVDKDVCAFVASVILLGRNYLFCSSVPVGVSTKGELGLPVMNLDEAFVI